MSDNQQLIDRREALRRGLRWGAMGGLGLLGAGLMSRGSECRVTDPCVGCREFTKCGLAKAQVERELKKEVGHE